MVLFRDKGFGVPSIALFLDLFSVKEASDGFLYLSRRTGAPLIITDLPSSHRLWKERYFFVRGCGWEYDPLDKDDTLGVPIAWTTPKNLRGYRFGLVWSIFLKSQSIANSALTICFSGVRLDLSPEDKVIKRELAMCLPHAYSELIKSDIPESSGSRSSRPATLRPSPPSVIKLSHDEPHATKPTKRELLAQVETLSGESRSVKRKTLDSPMKGGPS